MTLSITGLILTLSVIDTEHKWHAALHYATCHYAECHYAECRGAVTNQHENDLENQYSGNSFSSML
jgi:hypothetical protein